MIWWFDAKIQDLINNEYPKDILSISRWTSSFIIMITWSYPIDISGCNNLYWESSWPWQSQRLLAPPLIEHTMCTIYLHLHLVHTPTHWSNTQFARYVCVLSCTYRCTIHTYNAASCNCHASITACTDQTQKKLLEELAVYCAKCTERVLVQ